MAEPMETTQQIEDFLTGITGESRPEAIKSDRCVFCKGSATAFTDEVSRREYSISGMCQICQDDFFNEEDE